MSSFGARCSAMLLAVGLVMTTASQLRVSAFPIGPGELLLVGWCVLSLVHSGDLERGQPVRGGIVSLLCTFWASAFALLSIGAVHGMLVGHIELSAALHDAFAFVFCAGVAIQMARSFNARDAVLRAARYLPVVAAALLALLLVLALVVRQIGPVKFWYGGIRFSGWAENPNQLALLLVALPFLALQVRADSSSNRTRAFYASIAGVIAVIGIVTLSDALIVSWLLGAALVGSGAWFHAVFGRSARRSTILVYGILCPIMLLAILIPFVGGLEGAALDALSGIYSEGGQGSVRLTIWGNGVEAILQSPFYGLGPGPHSGLHSPNEGFEAHNTLVDWSASAGLLGLLAYIALLVVVAVAAVRGRKPFLLVSIVALCCFSLFHYVLRQPLFWGYLVVVLAYAGVDLVPLQRAKQVAA